MAERGELAENSRFKCLMMISDDGKYQIHQMKKNPLASSWSDDEQNTERTGPSLLLSPPQNKGARRECRRRRCRRFSLFAQNDMTTN